MDRQNIKKLNRLLAEWPAGTVAVQSWLEKQGFYRQLMDAYVKNGWLKRVGRGAYVRAGDKVDWTGGLYALQKQLGLSIHVGAQTALAVKGRAHYLEFGQNRFLMLFGTSNERLPVWFQEAPWKVKLVYASTNLFSGDRKLGLSELKSESFSITVSAPERAVMELIYLIPKRAHFEDAQLAMEGSTTFRPQVVQALLENCNSVKVKRFFMWLAEYNQHSWVDRLDLSKVDFGKGKRNLFKGGVFNRKYQITVPEYYGEDRAV